MVRRAAGVRLCGRSCAFVRGLQGEAPRAGNWHFVTSRDYASYYLMANEPVRSIDPKAYISLHPPSYRGLSLEAEVLLMLRACISAACFWRPEWLEAESSRLEHIPLAFWIVDALRPRSLVDLETCRAGRGRLAA